MHEAHNLGPTCLLYCTKKTKLNCHQLRPLSSSSKLSPTHINKEQDSAIKNQNCIANSKPLMAEEVKLFKTWSSPFGLRIVWALKLKGVEYESIDEDISNKSPLLLQYNPIYKKVPVLVHNGKPIVESLVILEYVDETWKQNPLLPADPYDRAMARFWAKFSDDKILPSVWATFVKEGKEQEEALDQTIENLKFLEEELKGKKFFGGEKIGFADLALGWLANLICVLEEISGLKIIDSERFPSLLAWTQDFAEVPIIKESWPPHDRLITKFQIMRENVRANVQPK